MSVCEGVCMCACLYARECLCVCACVSILVVPSIVELAHPQTRVQAVYAAAKSKEQRAKSKASQGVGASLETCQTP